MNYTSPQSSISVSFVSYINPDVGLAELHIQGGHEARASRHFKLQKRQKAREIIVGMPQMAQEILEIHSKTSLLVYQNKQ